MFVNKKKTEVVVEVVPSGLVEGIKTYLFAHCKRGSNHQEADSRGRNVMIKQISESRKCASFSTLYLMVLVWCASYYCLVGAIYVRGFEK